MHLVYPTILLNAHGNIIQIVSIKTLVNFLCLSTLKAGKWLNHFSGANVIWFCFISSFCVLIEIVSSYPVILCRLK